MKFSSTAIASLLVWAAAVGCAAFVPASLAPASSKHTTTKLAPTFGVQAHRNGNNPLLMSSATEAEKEVFEFTVSYL
jgi:hypothetical protein